jgi:hypothetical protein
VTPFDEVLELPPEWAPCPTCGATHSRVGRLEALRQAEPAETWRDVLAAGAVFSLLILALYVVTLAGAAYWMLTNSRPIPGGPF